MLRKYVTQDRGNEGNEAYTYYNISSNKMNKHYLILINMIMLIDLLHIKDNYTIHRQIQYHETRGSNNILTITVLIQ